VEFAVTGRWKAGLRSNGLVLHPDGRRLYVSNGGEATVSAIDAGTGAILATVPVGQRPWNMALSPDGKRLFVACGRSGTVTVIDTASHARVADIAVGKLPWGVTIR
jgi:YVTN family beta-propeller protein